MTSTITIDALSLGRPIINLNFDAIGGKPPRGMITALLRLQSHSATSSAQVRPPIAHNVDEVVAFVLRCIAGDQDTGADLDAFERCYVPADSHDYPKVVRRTVAELLRIEDGAAESDQASRARIRAGYRRCR